MTCAAPQVQTDRIVLSTHFVQQILRDLFSCKMAWYAGCIALLIQWSSTRLFWPKVLGGEWVILFYITFIRSSPRSSMSLDSNALPKQPNRSRYSLLTTKLDPVRAIKHSKIILRMLKEFVRLKLAADIDSRLI